MLDLPYHNLIVYSVSRTDSKPKFTIKSNFGSRKLEVESQTSEVAPRLSWITSSDVFLISST